MSLLSAFYFNTLKHPWMLLLLIGVVVLLIAELTARPSAALRISTGDTLARIRGRSRIFARHIPAVLRAIALSFLVLALARPLNGMRPRVEKVDVIDILLCVDVSGSMTAEDFVVGGHRRDRLFVTKLAVQDFVNSRRDRSEGRYGTDRLGLALYAKYAWIQCPLTLDYDVFERELMRVRIDKNDEKHSRTAIGSAIGLAVSNLLKSEAKSKVIILLTDGINNHGELDPITAAQIAKEYGIRVYTIGAGAAEGGMVSQNTLLGPVTSGRASPIDENALRRIAEETGAKYYRATDTDSLQEAYREINELETTEIEIGDAFEYDEGFVPYAFLGMAGIATSVFSRRRWYESIP